MPRDIQPLDAWLVFPPSYECYFMPEIALPRLTAYLKTQGKSVQQADWNALYWGDFLFRKGPFELFMKRLKTSFSVGDEGFYRSVRQLYARFLDRNIVSGESLRRFVYENRKELFNWLYEQTEIHRLNRDKLLERLQVRDPLMDTFLKLRLKTFFDRFEPSVVGISLVSPQQVVYACRFARELKRFRPNLPLVAGGPYVKLGRDFLTRKEYAFFFDFFEFFVTSDGEEPLLDLVNLTENKENFKETPNLIYRDANGHPQATHEKPSLPLDHLPPPDFSGLNFDLYTELSLPIERASMCYYRKCTFCWHNYNDRQWIQLDPEEIVRRIRTYIEQTGVRRFSFIDNAVNAQATKEICERLLAEKLEIEWFMQARFNKEFADPEYTELLARAGCRIIFFGLETAHKQRLKSYRKGIDLEKVPKMLENTSAQGIETSVYLILSPEEDRQEFEHTLKFCLRHRQHIHMTILQTFLLNRNCLAHSKPDLLGMDIAPETETTLDFFDLPYTSEGIIHDASYLATVRDRFVRLMRTPKPLGDFENESIEEIYKRVLEGHEGE